jgi:hypothetical protein
MAKWRPSNRAALNESRFFREVNARQHDTINALRETIRNLEAENERLNERLFVLEDPDLFLQRALAEVGCDECGEYKQDAYRLFEEVAKLRELLQRTWDAFHDATAREFVTVKNELRELGIEVDG